MARGAKRVVITGASSGIGRATAELFAARGARLVLAARGEDALEEVAIRCRALGGEAHVIPTDVIDGDAVKRLAQAAALRLGGIDFWFSDVGVGVVGRFHEVPLTEHRRVIEANLIGHVNDAHAVLPIFLDQGHGTFVNMISVGGFVATPWAAAYSASKFGLRGLSEALRAELSLHPRIHICDVYPTFVDTPGIEHAANHTGGRLSVPPGVLDPRKVARAVVRLADRPRNTTAVGAPVLGLKLTQFLAPNVSAAVMNGFFRYYFSRAEAVPETSGALFGPGMSAGIDGGFRRPDQRRKAALAVGGLFAAAGLVAWGSRRRAGPER
jgi:short-subunit dehydrogenase